MAGCPLRLTDRFDKILNVNLHGLELLSQAHGANTSNPTNYLAAEPAEAPATVTIARDPF